MPNPSKGNKILQSKRSTERWSSRTGIILAVASGAIGLGNFLRFPGQAAQNGGGAFMLPYIISFVLLGIPVVITEWIIGRMGSRYGHSAPFIFKAYLNGFPLIFTGAISIIIPVLIYVYYVFIEAWCLAYAYGFISNSIQLSGSREIVIQQASEYFTNITGSGENGSSFSSSIIIFSLVCFFINFYIVNRGLAKGLELLAKIAIPVMGIFSFIILVKVLTLDNIGVGLGKMWNPDWQALTNANVWIAAAGQIFFSLSAGFGIALVFSGFLTREDDVNLSSLSSASINEFAEVIFGGLITIPVAFLFLGDTVTQYGTFGMGFIALPAVFNLMPAGNVFGGLWFIVLFLAALTSSITMLQPAIIFMEEAFAFSRRLAILLLFVFTFVLFLPIIYFNVDFTALDNADFWVGTIMIYILATIQVIIFGWKVGAEKGIEEGNIGSIIKLPSFFKFIIKYVTPTLLIGIFLAFLNQALPDYIHKMDSSYMILQAKGVNESIATLKANIALGVFLAIVIIFILTAFIVHIGLGRHEK